MATPEQLLLSQMNPQQARLMDEQMRRQQTQQQSQGAGMLSGLVNAYSNMGRSVQGMVSPDSMPMGANEQQAVRQQEQQGLLRNAYEGPRTGDRVTQLRTVAKKLRATGSFEALMKAEQVDMQADQLQLKADELNVNRTKALMGASSKGMQTYKGMTMKDAEGNLYQTVIAADKDSGASSTKYVPLGDSPEYNKSTKLTPVVSSGENIGLDPFEAAKNTAKKEGAVVNAKKFNEIKVEAAQNYESATSLAKDLTRTLELIKLETEKGNLQGGVSAQLQDLSYALFGERPANMGELKTIFNENMFQQLKPLFGSQISDGERESVVDTFANIFKSGEVNLRLVDRMLNKTQGAMYNLEVLMQSDDYDQYTEYLVNKGRTETNRDPETGGDDIVQAYNPETGKIQAYNRTKGVYINE
jgi:hypothetical protein